MEAGMSVRGLDLDRWGAASASKCHVGCQRPSVSIASRWHDYHLLKHCRVDSKTSIVCWYTRNDTNRAKDIESIHQYSVSHIIRARRRVKDRQPSLRHSLRHNTTALLINQMYWIITSASTNRNCLSSIPTIYIDTLTPLIFPPIFNKHCKNPPKYKCNRTKHGGRMSRTSVSHFGRAENPDLVGLNPGRVKPIVLKLIFTTS